MDLRGEQLRNHFIQRQNFWIGTLIFCTCLFVYLANGQTISSNDNVPNSILALHWLDNNSLNFDAFRGGLHYRPDTLYGAGGIPYYFVEAPNGHLSSTYPIGTAIVTFPLYCLFFLFIKLSELIHYLTSGQPIDLLTLTQISSRALIQDFQKLAATIVTAFSVVIFYLITRLKFNFVVSLITTFVFAFATSTWATNSQGLWQHGSANLLVLSIIFCLLKANRSSDKQRKSLLVLAGFFCGLLPGVRPTSLLYSLAAIAYSVLIYRQESIFLLIGLPSALLNASWNFYYFGISLKNFFVGGYTRMSLQDKSFAASYYVLTIQQFIQGFTGLLVSPNRGLLIYTPVTLFAIPGILNLFKLRKNEDEQLILAFSTAGLIVFFQYCVFTIWSGGWCYGPRYLTDIIPVLCLLIAYFVAHVSDRLSSVQDTPLNHQPSLRWFQGVFIAFLVVTSVSVFTQVVGVFGSTNWDGIPYPSDHRLWNWEDTQISRHTNALINKIHPPIPRPRHYLRQLDGEILHITDQHKQPIVGSLTVSLSQQMTLKAEVKNTGNVRWFGYETGLSRGLIAIRVRFFDQNNQEIDIGERNFLFISGKPQPGDVAQAIGSILFPPVPGDYKAVFDLFLSRVGEIGSPSQSHTIHVTVQS